MRDDPNDVTGALMAHANGDANAADRLLPLIYENLRALAGANMRRERADHTLQPTALVHEAYLRLIDTSKADWRGRTHFFAIAAIQMRRVLVEYARAHQARKRGGGARKVTLDDAVAVSPEGTLDFVALNEALDELARRSPRQCRVVELRYFGGLSVEETAHVMGVSEGTVKRDWRLAKARLARELSSA